MTAPSSTSTSTSTTTTTATAAEALAQFAVSTRFETLPPDVVRVVKRAIADGVACAVAGSAMPHSRAIERYAVGAGPGPASVLGRNSTLPVEEAALVNASSMHGIESDDYHTGALAHPGCTTVPVALALAEEGRLSGEDVIAGVAVGMEVTLRMGRALMPSMIRDRGFHETGVTGVFGAAAVTANLGSLDAATAAHGLAIAASHAAGTTEFTHSGGEVKRLHAGVAAAAGCRSARLAQAGLTGPLTVFEGPRGVLQAYAVESDAEALTTRLGEWWDVLDTSIKPHACCGALLAPISHLTSLLAEGIQPDDITGIDVLLDSTSSRHVGTVGPRPHDLIGAQMSAHYSLAMTLAGRGNSIGSYVGAVEENFTDPRVAKFADLVRVSSDPVADAARPEKMLGTVVVSTKDGRSHTAGGVAPGTSTVPLSDAEFSGKLHALMDPALGSDVVTRLEEQIAQIETSDIRALMALARPRAGRR